MVYALGVLKLLDDFLLEKSAFKWSWMSESPIREALETKAHTFIMCYYNNRLKPPKNRAEPNADALREFQPKIYQFPYVDTSSSVL